MEAKKKATADMSDKEKLQYRTRPGGSMDKFAKKKGLTVRSLLTAKKKYDSGKLGQ